MVVKRFTKKNHARKITKSRKTKMQRGGGGTSTIVPIRTIDYLVALAKQKQQEAQQEETARKQNAYKRPTGALRARIYFHKSQDPKYYRDKKPIKPRPNKPKPP